jgi:hypothetical protein
MDTFKSYIKNLKKKNKKKKHMPGALTPVRRDSLNMPNTANLPAGGPIQPRLS